MDIGHGTGSFAYATAEALMAAGRTPDVISTDLHQLSINGPAYDLPTRMSKFLHLGMSLEDVVRATTSRPAEILGLERRDRHAAARARSRTSRSSACCRAGSRSTTSGARCARRARCS